MNQKNLESLDLEVKQVEDKPDPSGCGSSTTSRLCTCPIFWP